MDYDFRNNRSSSMYGRPAAGGGGGSSFYPRVGQPSGPPPPARQAPPLYSQPTSAPPPSSSSSSSGLGIRVAIKSEYRITPPPQLAPQMGEVPRSTFQFDFDFEKKILAEADKGADKGCQNWSKLAAENLPSKTTTSHSSMESVGDPVVNKYIASGLGREPASLAVLNYGDNPIKVREFVKGYNLLREMGFSSKNVGEALAMYDNDTDKALGHLINNSS